MYEYNIRVQQSGTAGNNADPLLYRIVQGSLLLLLSLFFLGIYFFVNYHVFRAFPRVIIIVVARPLFSTRFLSWTTIVDSTETMEWQKKKKIFALER